MNGRLPGPAVIVAVHDGFYGCGTGAGHSNHAFIQILARQLPHDVHLAVLPVLLRPGSSEYDQDWHRQTSSMLTGARCTIIPISNGTGGNTRFGGLARFRAASSSAAEIITALAPAHAPCLIVAFDVPFFGLAPLLPRSLRPMLVNVPRSTAALHAPADTDRAGWEQAGLQATADADGRIAAISRHMRAHLTGTYAIPDRAVTDLINGLTTDEQPPGPPDTAVLPVAAAGGFLLSLGRAEPYKGFDDLLDALVILRSQHLRIPHTALAAVADGPVPTPYQEHLTERARLQHLDMTILTTFTPGNRGLLAHPALAGVIIPSRAEPFGRIPLDAWAAGAAPVVATTAGGLAEQVTDGITGYTADPANPRSLAAAIGRALVITPAQRLAMAVAGRQVLATRYDYEANIRCFLAAVAPWAIAAPQPT